MTMQMPPTEPLDEQEREFARIVRALPGGEPPAALDARILRAAANAAASSRRPGAGWLASAGALWGVGGAAAAVLALGVSWHMMNPMRSSSAPEAATAPAMADRAEDSSVQVEFKDKPAPAYPAAPPPPALSELSAAPQRRARANASQPGAPPPAMAAPVPEPFALDSLDEHVASGAEADASRDAAAPMVAEREAMAGYASKSAAQDSARAASAKAASTAAESRARAESARTQLGRADNRGQAAGAAAPTADADAGLLKPADWLNYIRRLRDEDRTEEAKASMVEFRRRYPYSTIPPDLAPLLRE
ncbi:MAG: hypothetical protein WC213_12835 [Arenimonas sp.]|jgi:Meckel syndrome type 1 protein